MSFVVPDAGTLPTAKQQLRLAGPVGLAATARDLTARETECCSFFTFTVTAAGPADDVETVVLDVAVPAQ
ncbi:hypothetical protein DMB66_18460 [Actinoplanes sp. ATCC 53533]|uniref:hypothetical protein n=1 Tax=Actinoplanes sp. ATCC 53533 TaxID=1288362 RepID=UPI000F7B31A1|nr:hypothetical protein [Actinoplanes sp. ATCC 53533]RSM64897.1 hypothetical protein DMB66_18460 [Actinoplanes sp. ATCC 53533]